MEFCRGIHEGKDHTTHNLNYTNMDDWIPRFAQPELDLIRDVLIDVVADPNAARDLLKGYLFQAVYRRSDQVFLEDFFFKYYGQR